MVDRYRYALIVVVLHLAFLVIHAAAHVALAILPQVLDSIFIVAVMFVSPVLALALLRRRPGVAWTLPMGFAASFAYGAMSHYVLPGPDNAFALPAGAWAAMFQATTAGLAVLEALGILAGFALVLPLRTLSGPAGPRA